MTCGRAPELGWPLLLLLGACGPGAAPCVPALHFVDATAASGLAGFRNVCGSPQKDYVSETFGAGVALFDFDRDGDLDCYLTNGSRHAGFESGSEPRDALFAGDGTGAFEECSARLGLGDTGWTSGVRVADVQGDGWPDIYLTNHGPNVLYLNEGGARFQDVTQSAGVGDPRWSTGAAFFDFDRDGDLDLYVANYVEFDLEWVQREARQEEYRGVTVLFGPHGLPGSPDRFYVNGGQGSFQDVSEQVGVSERALFGFQVVVFDADADGWLDAYVANDSEPNLLWHNEQGERFVDVAPRVGLALSLDGGKQAGMGVALGDYDGDLQADLYVTNFSGDYFTLYRAVGDGFYVDSTKRAGLRFGTTASLGWGCGFEDFDSDGDLDLFAVNGHVYPQVDGFNIGTTYRQKNDLFENQGAGRFVRLAGAGGPGFALIESSRGAAIGDVDNDGRRDLLIGNLDGAPRLLMNVGRVGNSLSLRLVGSAPNRDAVGARVLATVAGRRMLRLVGSSSGFLSSNDPRIHFGLGDAARIDQLDVLWPSGQSERTGPIAAGACVTLEEGAGITARVDYASRR